MHGDRLDLRGISFGGRTLTLEGTMLRSIDFSKATLTALRLPESTLEDCRFDGADLQDLRVRRSVMRRCTLSAADLRGASLGEWSDGLGNTYEDVSFVDARMLRMSTAAAYFVRCDFSGADLRQVNFWQSSIIDCKFGGLVKDAVFDGRMLGEQKPDPNPMLNVDFTEAVFKGCDFRGVDFSSIALPDDRDLILIDDIRVIKHAEAILAKLPQTEDAEFFTLILAQIRRFHRPGAGALVNLRDLGSTGGAFRRLIDSAKDRSPRRAGQWFGRYRS
ncbi:MAG TPA: pentapeptide repeat-containing protein [Micromonosporaceae bacterium]